MKQVANESPAPRTRYHLVPHESAVRPEFDAVAFNRFTDELEDKAIMNKTRSTS